MKLSRLRPLALGTALALFLVLPGQAAQHSIVVAAQSGIAFLQRHDNSSVFSDGAAAPPSIGEMADSIPPMLSS